MELVHECSKIGIRAILIRGLGTERLEAERELVEAGISLPVWHRVVWAQNLCRVEPWFLLLRDADGRACAGLAIERIPTRAMPWHLNMRVRGFGGNLPIEASRVALEALTRVALSEPRILRLQVLVFSRHYRDVIAEKAQELGFQRPQRPSTYRSTLTIDLRPTEEEIFAALGKSARTRIRETLKKSLRSIAITESKYADKIEELQQEALRKTGGRIAPEDWRGVLQMSKERPDLSQVFGLFMGDETDPENMRAFGWVCSHGDHGEYRAAGSARRGDVRIPFSYLLVWDMIRWSKATGAEWFDLGGVVLDGADGSALQGISQFKSYFSHDLIEVGEEWIFEPSPMRARVADRVSDGAQQVRSWFKKEN